MNILGVLSHLAARGRGFVASRTGRVFLALAAFVAPAVATASAFASGASPYSITPITSSVTTELTSSIPLVLAIAGGLIALAIAVRLVRKFVKA